MSGAVQIQNLTKRFGAKVAVDDLSLTIPAGSFFGLLGPNGAGKTTTLRMATGLLRPDAGQVVVDGSDVWADPAAAKAIFGVVPDDPNLFDRLSGRELLEYHGLLRRLPADEVARRSGELLDFLALTADADTLVADYSLGMTKKIALATALLHSPRVLFLDEPFRAIDPVAQQSVEALLKTHVERGGTVVFSSHVLDVVQRLCDRLAIIADGRVLRSGTTGEIAGERSLTDVFVELVGAQAVTSADVNRELGWLGSSSD